MSPRGIAVVCQPPARSARPFVCQELSKLAARSTARTFDQSLSAWERQQGHIHWKTADRRISDLLVAAGEQEDLRPFFAPRERGRALGFSAIPMSQNGHVLGHDYEFAPANIGPPGSSRRAGGSSSVLRPTRARAGSWLFGYSNVPKWSRFG